MNALRAVFLFRVNELLVQRAALGTSYVVKRQGGTVEISLPKDDDDFRNWKLNANEHYMALGLSAGKAGDPKEALGVRVIRVSVETEGDVCLHDFTIDERGAASRATKIFSEAHELASALTLNFLGLIRAFHGFHWLKLSSDDLELVGITSLVEIASGKRLPVGYGSTLYGVVFRAEDALTPADIEAIITRISNDETPPVAEVLLADAGHLATAGLGYRSSDGLRAVLMAAIACEVKAKINLRERATSDQKALIDYMLSNQREITLTAAELFNKIMKATQRRSLREDDPGLFKEITQLFQIRNLVAHQGKPPTIEEARKLVGTARRAFKWLDEEPPQLSGSASQLGG